MRSGAGDHALRRDRAGGAVFLRPASGRWRCWPGRAAACGARGPHRDVAPASAVALTGVNLCFYAALERLPLGIAVTLEFVGPLGVAIAGSRRPRDVVWVVLAAAGIVLLSDGAAARGSTHSASCWR